MGQEAETDATARALCGGDCRDCTTPAAKRINRREARLRTLERELAIRQARPGGVFDLEIARARAVADLFFLKNYCAFKTAAPPRRPRKTT